jgi:hypothetical protein
LELKLKNIDKVFENIKSYPEDLKKVINNEFKAFGIGTVNDAKRLASVNEGFLRNNISSNSSDLKVSISVNVDYAAYLEFGTKSFAASYVSLLPPDWQTFAAEYKGRGGGSFKEFVMNITEWVRLKGIDIKAAYPIALKILKTGIRPHPYLLPAFEKNKIELIKNLKAQLNAK